MRSNFIKELESCTVTFPGPFCKHPIGILTVCVCKLAHVCVQEGMNEPGVPWGTAGGFSSVIFHRTNAAHLKLPESVPSGGQRSRDCYTHPFQLRTEKPDSTTVNISPNRTSSSSSIGKLSNRRLSLLLIWLAEVQWTSVPLESEAMSRLTASSLMRFEKFP